MPPASRLNISKQLTFSTPPSGINRLTNNLLKPVIGSYYVEKTEYM